MQPPAAYFGNKRRTGAGPGNPRTRVRGSRMPEVAIILPAYNEAKRLEKTVERVTGEMNGTGITYEIIIAEDGAKDGTDTIAAQLAQQNPAIRHIHSTERSGRGRALNRSFAATDADIVIYCDVDLATDTKHLRQLIDAIRGGYDVATGSRLMKDSDVERPFNREFASRGYNSLVRLRPSLEDLRPPVRLQSFQPQDDFATAFRSKRYPLVLGHRAAGPGPAQGHENLRVPGVLAARRRDHRQPEA